MTQHMTTPASISPFDLLDDELVPKAADGIGLVAPFDFALDGECLRWLPAGVTMFTTRTPALDAKEVTVTLAQEVSSAAAVSPAVQSLLAVSPAAIGYACTSGSFVGGLRGEEALRDVMLAAGAPAAVTTSGALISALQAVGARNIAIATPYNAELTQLLADFLDQAGVGVSAGTYLDMEQDIARISPAAVERMAHAIDAPEADALFFSCTNLQTFDVIEKLETQLGKPILSANQVTIWATLRAGGLPMPRLGQRLFAATIQPAPSH